MKGKPKCKKCGRVLKSPLSIALGMGPKCAGISLAKGQDVRVVNRRSSGVAYAGPEIGSVQTPLIPSSKPEKKVSKRELVRKQRSERRRLFEQRKSFQCGFLAGGKTPLIYEPAGEKEWKDKASGGVLSQERLQDYLKRYRFI
ncbi:MAG: DUF6011 domain-containing protein [Chloroflexota bacterium]